MKKSKLFGLIFLAFVFIGTKLTVPVNAEIPVYEPEIKVVYLPQPSDPRVNLKLEEKEIETEVQNVRDTVFIESVKERFITRNIPVYKTIEVNTVPKISDKALEKIAPIKMAGVSNESCPHLN